MHTVWSCPDCAAWQVDVDTMNAEAMTALESVLEDHYLTCGTVRTVVER